jgi:hypothetical protein
MTALQAALAGAGGFGQGVVAQREMERRKQKEEQDRARQEAMDAESKRRYEEERSERQAMNLANLISSGKAVEMREEPAGLPPSVIPLPRADQVGGRAGIDIGGRRLAIRGGEELSQIEDQRALNLALRRAEAELPLEMRRAGATAGATARASAGVKREEAQAERLAAFESLKAMGALTPMDQYNKNRKYEAELESAFRTRERQAGSGLGALMSQGMGIPGFGLGAGSAMGGSTAEMRRARGVDEKRYASDTAYRSWVDTQLAGSP